jgi:hypothetical protein
MTCKRCCRSSPRRRSSYTVRTTRASDTKHLAADPGDREQCPVPPPDGQSVRSDARRRAKKVERDWTGVLSAPVARIQRARTAPLQHKRSLRGTVMTLPPHRISQRQHQRGQPFHVIGKHACQPPPQPTSRHRPRTTDPASRRSRVASRVVISSPHHSTASRTDSPSSSVISHSALPARRSASATAAFRSRKATRTRTARSSNRFSRAARSRRLLDCASSVARRASCLIDR